MAECTNKDQKVLKNLWDSHVQKEVDRSKKCSKMILQVSYEPTLLNMRTKPFQGDYCRKTRVMNVVCSKDRLI